MSLFAEGVHPITGTCVFARAYRQYPDGSVHEKIASCSGFFWRSQENLFVVTNWHNVTGRNQQSGRYMGSFSPSHLRIAFQKIINRFDTRQVIYSTTNADLPLLDSDGEPIWAEHPSGRNVDLAAVPVSQAVARIGEVYTMNELSHRTDWQVEVGADCFIVGYPEGFIGPMATPIWKRASISSEPSLDFGESPVFLVDSIGNKGLSGSPVVARAQSIFTPWVQTDKLPCAHVFSWTRFLGVYSGRLGEDGVESQMGRVWRESLIDEVLQSNGCLPFQRTS